MRFSSSISNLALALATFTSAMPVNPSTDVPDTPATGLIDWYQGPVTFPEQSAIISPSATCGTKVSHGNLTADGACKKLSTYAFGLHHNQDQACNYRLWSGVTDCSGSSYTDIPIPEGSGVTCINDGVLDGGRFYLASGIYTCK